MTDDAFALLVAFILGMICGGLLRHFVPRIFTK